MANGLNLVIFSFTVVIYQRINLHYGEHGDNKKTFEYVMEACKKAAIYFPYGIIMAYYVIPAFFSLMFPEYVGSTFYLRCFAFAGYFYSIFLLLNYSLMTIKKQRILNMTYIIAIAIGSMAYFFVTTRFELKYVAYLVILMNILLMLSNLYISRKSSGGIYKKRRLLAILLPTPILLFMILRTIDSYMHGSNFVSYIIKAMIALVVYTVVHKATARFHYSKGLSS
jgi:O-antigen/teichoic acid export membrane protein